jgi:hypothetical protein
VNTTFTAHVDPPRKLGGQLLVWLKSAVFVPPMPKPLMESDDDPAFEIVIVCGALAVPELCAAKCTLAGEI